MVHDECIVCRECAITFTISKSGKSLIIGIEYCLILAAVGMAITLKTIWPCLVIFVLIAVMRLLVLPKMAIEKKRELNRLRKYRKPKKP